MPDCPKCQTDLPLQGEKCLKCGADINWWSSRDGQVYGPFDLATVHFCRQDGRIVDDDYVRIGDGPWALARDVLPAHAEYTPKPFPSQLAPVAPLVKPAKSSRSTYLVVGLVVVVGLLMMLGIMAAILFPVFARARDRAQTAACMANLKQISAGLRMYANAHAGRLPPGVEWSKECSFYLKPRPQGPDLWVCPTCGRHYVVNSDYSNQLLAAPAPGTRAAPMLSCPEVAPGAGGPHMGGYCQLFPDGRVEFVRGAPSPGR